jgi:hypothetical protein
MNPVAQDELPLVDGAERVVYAKDQPPYIPLPVNRYPDGLVFSEWEPTAAERLALARGAGVRVRLWQWTHGMPLQPVAVELVDGKGAVMEATARPQREPLWARLRAAWRALVG